MLPTSEIGCALCGQNKADKYKKRAKGYQPYKCPNCGKALPEDFDNVYFNRHLSTKNVHSILHPQAQASSLCAVSLISRLAYDNLISLIRAIRQKLQDKLQDLLMKVVLRKPRPRAK